MEENVNNAEETVVEEQPDKKFSQDEVNEIVKKRLQREHEKLDAEWSAKLEEKTVADQEDLVAREIAVECKEFLIDNHYPLELLDVIGANDINEFKEKITQLDGLLQPRGSMPMYDAEPMMTGHNAIRNAFSPDARHKPKSWY